MYSNIPRINPNQPGFVSCVDIGAGAKRYTTFICGVVMDPMVWYPIINTMDLAGDMDEIVIKLTTPGGSVSLGIVILNAMQHSKATVTVEAVGMVASIGTVLLCGADVAKVSPMATLLFHKTSGGCSGKMATAVQTMNDVIDNYEVIFRKYCSRILSAEEIEHVLSSNQDYYVTADKANGALKKPVTVQEGGAQ